MKKKNLLQRSIIIGIVTLAGLYIVIGPHGRRPHFKDFTYSGITATLQKNINLGLDLRGGSQRGGFLKCSGCARIIGGMISLRAGEEHQPGRRDARQQHRHPVQGPARRHDVYHVMFERGLFARALQVHDRRLARDSD